MTNALNKCKSVKGLFGNEDMFCFYSGIKLHTEAHHKQGLKASIEHLIPVSNKKGFELSGNLVPCATVVNQMIGNAPLKVKYALKDYFNGFTFHPAMDDKAVIEMMKHIISIFLTEYQIYGMYMWQWNDYYGKKKVNATMRLERKRELYAAYLLLLTEEEKAIGAYKKWDLKEKA